MLSGWQKLERGEQRTPRTSKPLLFYGQQLLQPRDSAVRLTCLIVINWSACTCVHGWGQPEVLLCSSSLPGPELTEYIHLGGQQILETHLCVPFQCLWYKNTLPWLGCFYMGSEDHIQVQTRQALYWRSYGPRCSSGLLFVKQYLALVYRPTLQNTLMHPCVAISMDILSTHTQVYICIYFSMLNSHVYKPRIQYNTTQTAEDDSCSRCRTFFSSQVSSFIS